jgi:hypothetical protein
MKTVKGMAILIKRPSHRDDGPIAEVLSIQTAKLLISVASADCGAIYLLRFAD